MLNNRKARVTTLVATGAAAAAALTAGGTGQAQAAGGGVWDRVAQCESGGNWQINTGNGYYGGLQFTPSTWRAFGGQGMPQNASRSAQIAVAQRVLAGQGPGAWPVCSKRAGLTRSNGGAASSAAPDRASRSEERKTERTTPRKAERTQERTTPRKAERKQVERKTTTHKHVQRKQVERKQVERTSVERAPKHAAKRQPIEVPSVKTSGQTITVKSGDTLSKLAEKHDISSWRQLWAANSKTVSNPNLIFVGQTLQLPA